jgi:hypothetical protein
MGANSWDEGRATLKPKLPLCRHVVRSSLPHALLAMQKVEGSNPFSRSRKGLHCRSFRCSSRVGRLRHRTMTGQSCPWRLADANGRRSVAGDSGRPAPWNFCVPAEDQESTAPGRCSCPTGTPNLVRGRSAAFVEGTALSSCAPARRPGRVRRWLRPGFRLCLGCDSERRPRSNSCPSSCSTISGTPATSAAPTKPESLRRGGQPDALARGRR